MKRIKFAILGMGRIGKVHADTIQANSNAELAAIHDPINNEINSCLLYTSPSPRD